MFTRIAPNSMISSSIGSSPVVSRSRTTNSSGRRIKQCWSVLISLYRDLWFLGGGCMRCPYFLGRIWSLPPDAPEKHCYHDDKEHYDDERDFHAADYMRLIILGDVTYTVGPPARTVRLLLGTGAGGAFGRGGGGGLGLGLGVGGWGWGWVGVGGGSGLLGGGGGCAECQIELAIKGDGSRNGSGCFRLGDGAVGEGEGLVRYGAFGLPAVEAGEAGGFRGEGALGPIPLEGAVGGGEQLVLGVSREVEVGSERDWSASPLLFK